MVNPLFESPFRAMETDGDGLSRRQTIFDGERIGQKVEIESDIHRSHLQALRSENISRNGMTRGGTRRHIASIPVEIWMSWQRKYGQNLTTDRKLLKRLIKDYKLHVVDPGSF